MSKKLCDKKKKSKEGKHICKKCGRKSDKKKRLCNPLK